ncbi:MAG: hypothetical protein KJ060_08840, partial [Candidatus Hydrogenedentes bacterium]|nr:hypothetical protein [Candidatus Hydrogenedentota bacterium]
MSNNFFRVSRRTAYWLIPCVVIALSGCAGLGIPGAPGTEQTALDRYVAESDPSYTYSIEKTIDGEGYSVFVIDLTSQSWRSPDEVDRTEWKHWLTIIKPDELESQTGLLVIGGGRNGRPAPDGV